MKALVAAGTPVGHDRRQDLGPPCHRGAGRVARRELRMIADSVAFCACRVAEVDLRCRAFLRRLRQNPDYALQNLQGGSRGRRRLDRPVRYQRRHLPEEIAEAVDTVTRGDSSPAGHSHPQRRRAGGRQYPGRRSGEALARFRGRSTAWASGAATSTSVA